MSQQLLKKLEATKNQYPKHDYPKILKGLAEYFQKKNIIINGQKMIVPPEKWGEGYVAAKKKYINRYKLFIVRLFQGEFHKAKQMLEYNNMDFLNFPSGSDVRKLMLDQIMYEIVAVLEEIIDHLGRNLTQKR
jgi:succinyl-CoA synthetase beta subunit